MERIDRAARELAGAIAGRVTPVRGDPFADPVPFDRLLRSSRDASAD